MSDLQNTARARADLNKLLERYGKEMFELGYKVGKSGVIHCKDCKYWPYQLLPYSENTTADPTYPHCFDFKSDGYCSLGKRKEK